MSLKPWNELPYAVRSTQKGLYEYMRQELEKPAKKPNKGSKKTENGE